MSLGILLSVLLTVGSCTNNDSASGSNSFFPIQITIVSANGTDLSSSTPVLYSNNSLSTLQKRSSTSVPINPCSPTNTWASSSWCQREDSPQRYETVCVESPQQGRTNPQQQTLIRQGKCALDEICIGSNAKDTGTSRQAYCVATTHFVRIGHDPPSGSGSDTLSSGLVTASFNSSLYDDNNGSQLAVEAVVTHLNKLSSLFATSVVIQAQAYNNGVWRNVAGGIDYCMSCSSMTLAPFPITAQRVKVDVVMPEWSPTGLLWLASYSY